MALNFPDSPTDGQKYTDATTGETWTYEASTNSWTSDGLTTSAGIIYKGGIDITAAPPAGAANGWQYTVTTGGTANAGFTGLTGNIPAGTTILYDGTNWQEAGAGALPASETTAGIVELATAAETTAGTDASRAVHPAGLKVELDKKAADAPDGTAAGTKQYVRQVATTGTGALAQAKTWKEPSFTQSGTGAVTRSIDSKLKDVVSVKDFGAVGDGSTNSFSAISAAWTYALSAGKDLYFPAGIYVSEDLSFPIGRIDGSAPSSLLDCKGITVFGEGSATVLKTTSATGADVLQINGAKNLKLRGFKITATITGTSGAGSNGVSVTGGGDNLIFEDIEVVNLPYVDKGTHLDGGKAFTLQLGSLATSVGNIELINCRANGCVYGFEHNPVLDDLLTQKAAISFTNCYAENCWYGGISSAPAAGVALPEGFNGGIAHFNVTCVNCQHGFMLGRNHGGQFDVVLKTTKSAAQLKLDPTGSAWSPSLDTTVDGFTAQYAHNSFVNVTGYLNDVEYKARIGGATAGSSGLIGATFNSNMYIDLGGTASIADVFSIDSGGNTLRESKLVVSATTTSSALPSDFYLPSNLNSVEHVSTKLSIPAEDVSVKSIAFPATFAPVADANTLDDYEEGVWVPTLWDTSLVDKGAAYYTAVGAYTKIGNVVYITGYLSLSSLGTLTTGSAAFIGNLPFASQNRTSVLNSVSIGFASSLSLSSAAIVTGTIGTNEAYISLRKWDVTSTTGTANLTINEITASGILVFSGSYFT